MKRFFFTLFLIQFFITSCNFNSGSTIENQNWKYSTKTPYVKLEQNVNNITIDGLYDNSNEKYIYLVKLNNGYSVISKNDTGYISINSNNESNRVLQPTDDTDFSQSNHHISMPVINPYKLLNENNMPIFSQDTNNLARTLETNDKATTIPNKNYSVGDSKNIFIDNNKNLSNYISKPATLRAIGKHCYVWIIDDYYSSVASEDKINTEVAEKYAEIFDNIYNLETYVFGYESDKIFNIDTGKLENLSEQDTGTMINIVFYDIANDYEPSQSGGTCGYFFSRDYYTCSTQKDNTFNYSNKGKYFYLDSYFANKYQNVITSTLAHEFQHMICYNKKTILYNEKPDTWFTEMLSMLAEDMLQEYLNLSNEDSPKIRLKLFNINYYLSGVTEWRTDINSYDYISYSTAYAFGAWLCRQYGGANLVNKIMNNSYSNEASIVAAVKEITGKSKSFENLLEEYVRALVFSDISLGQPTLNQDAEKSLVYNKNSIYYDYPMKAINLFSSEYKNVINNNSYFGPVTLYASTKGNIEIRPKGFSIHYIGYTYEDTISISLYPTTSPNENMYIMVEKGI